jgi:large subunit ribosomal protein L25
MATLNARLRDGRGKGVARKLRAAGQIPAVAYGHGLQGRSLSLDAHELELLLGAINPENTIIELRIEGAKPAQALIREVQKHPSRPQILHVDFFQVRAGEKLHVEIPIRLLGTPKGVRDEGGILQEVLRELSVECLPGDIPSSVDIEIGELGLGDSVHVSDVTLEKVTILNDPEIVICTISTPTVEALPETEVEEEGVGEVEPELIRDRDEAGAPSSEKGQSE